MTEKQVCIYELTEDEKKQKKRDYMREYMRNRRLQCPEFAEKIKTINRNYRIKASNNIEMVEKNREMQRNRYKRMSDAYKNQEN